MHVPPTRPQHALAASPPPARPMQPAPKPDARAAADGPARILVVEDDRALRQEIVDFLDEHGMCAIAASGRREMLRYFDGREPNLVVLDLPPQGDDGLELLREIRSRSNVPIIVASGQCCDERDRVVALELGADDYLMRPFGLRELVARIRAVLRREQAARKPRAPAARGGWRFGGWRLRQSTRCLTDPDGAEVILTRGEYTLLTAFLQAPQRPLTRMELMQAAHIHEDVFDRSIDVQVVRLRRKLERTPRAPEIIQTERGVGYVFALPVDPL